MAAHGALEVAAPYDLGDTILDADEDSQVVVFEQGEVTSWALQSPKWRMFFHIPDDFPTPEGDEEQLEDPAEPQVAQEERGQGVKRKAEAAGLELN